jgi:HD-GYP domain-containing protein (c-di-GMP phosphodiesterase class II)
MWMAVLLVPVSVLGAMHIHTSVPVLMDRGEMVRAVSGIIIVALTVFLSILGYVLSRREATARLRQQALTSTKLEELFKLTVNLEGCRSQMDVAETVVDAGTQILGAERSSFSLIRDGRAKLVALKTYESPSSVQPSGEFLIDVDTGVIGDALHTGASIRLVAPSPDRVPLDRALKQSSRDVIVAPVFHEEAAVGAIEVSNPEHGGTFSEIDVNMLEHMARAAGMALDVVMSRENLEAQRRQILDLLAETLESTVVWAGHLTRCEELCMLIGRSMGLSFDELEAISVAAKLHDIGLSTGEDRHAHPVEGARMVATLGMSPLVGRIIGSHHERIDGTGYPLGLTADDLPIGARILMVVEAFDAHTNPNSPHRDRTVEQFCAEAPNDPGLDSTVVRALCEILDMEAASEAAQN